VRRDRLILESYHIDTDSCGNYGYHFHLPIHTRYYLSESPLSIDSEFLPSTRTSNCHSVFYFQFTLTKTITQWCSKHTKFSIPVIAK